MAMSQTDKLRLAAQFNYKVTDIVNFEQIYQDIDDNGDHRLTPEEVMEGLNKAGTPVTRQDVDELISKVDVNGDGVIQFDEFVQMCADVRDGRITGKIAETSKKLAVNRREGQGGGYSSYAQEEVDAYCEHLSNTLAGDPDLEGYLAIGASADKDERTRDLCAKLSDGWVLAKLINLIEPNMIDIRAMSRGREVFHKVPNCDIVVQSAKGLGAQLAAMSGVNLAGDPDKPADDTITDVLAVVWQLVKLHLLSSINLRNCPELVLIKHENERLEDLLKLPADQLLLRWINYHLERAGSNRRANNFDSDLQDSEIYTILLNQISPNTNDLSPLNQSDLHQRAGMIIDGSKRVGVSPFIKPADIVKGNKKLNLGFVAQIFNACPGLNQLTEEEEKEFASLLDDDFGDSREERAFRMWINSLSVPDPDNANNPYVYVNNLIEDCRDGIVLLRILDHMQPGCVNWRRVEFIKKLQPTDDGYLLEARRAPGKRMNNCGMVYEITMRKNPREPNPLFPSMNVRNDDSSNMAGGNDSTNRAQLKQNRTFVLGFLWQLMREDIIRTLSKLGDIDDAGIMAWCNENAGGLRMRGFADKSLSTSHFFFALLDNVAKMTNKNIRANPEIVHGSAGDQLTEEQKLENARYALSVARSLGAVVFLLPEDIVEVKKKMILTFCAAVMGLATL